jgi:hypothetical protein
MASTASPASSSDKADPALMGVSIPLSVTVSAAKQVGAAWQKFGLDLVQAVKTARETKSAPAEEKPAAESGASAAAGVNA